MRLAFLLLFTLQISFANNYNITIESPSQSFLENESNTEKINALNNYVDFINESTHGLLIVVKLLENFNLDINKYVDLASYKINQYNNDDLPKDIFEDLDHWFYEVTPYELYQKAIAGGQSLSSKTALDGLATQMKGYLTSINQIRFDLEEIIKQGDLEQKANLNKVYEKLEFGVKLYKDFYQAQLKMEALIKKESVGLIDQDYVSLLKIMDNLYASSRELLIRIRDKETLNYDKVLQIVKRSNKELSTFNTSQYPKMKASKFTFNWDNLKSASNNLNKSLQEFNSNGVVSEQYEIYGKFYYFYNVYCISKFNRYGTGIVSGMNNVLSHLKIPRIKYTELPHYFKVIYPKKLEKVDFVETKETVIEIIPNQIKERKVATLDKKIRVTEEVVEFLFYDHMIQDGDVASVSFNGEWIFEKEELELAPKKFKLKLNKSGKNYLLLHADNIGQRPPCTIGVSYMMGGTKKEIILSSDLSVSEIVELEIVE